MQNLNSTPEYILPSKHKFALMAATLFLALLLFKLPVINTFLYVISMFSHELGHATFGWLFGQFSVPLPMVTLHHERSTNLQILSIVALIGYSYWLYLRHKEWFTAGVALTLFVIITALTPYWQFFILYMGEGGTVIAGWIILYKTWVDKKNNLIKQGAFAFIGFGIIFYSINRWYEYLYTAEKQAEYAQKHPFGMHNDFTRIAQEFSISEHNLALFTISLSVLAIICSFLMAIVPAKQPAK